MTTMKGLEQIRQDELRIARGPEAIRRQHLHAIEVVIRYIGTRGASMETKTLAFVPDVQKTVIHQHREHVATVTTRHEIRDGGIQWDTETDWYNGHGPD